MNLNSMKKELTGRLPNITRIKLELIIYCHPLAWSAVLKVLDQGCLSCWKTNCRPG